MVSLPDLIVPLPRHFGLSIGRNSLRGVEVFKNQQVRLAEVALAEDTFADGVLVKKEELVKALRELVTKGKFISHYAAISIPELYTYTREYHLPIIDEEDIHEAVSWHLKDLFPFPPAEIYFDWKIFTKDTSQYHLVVMAVQKQVIDQLVEALIAAGIKPLNFEPGASAITQFLVIKPEIQVIVLEVNRRGAFVTFVDQERAFFTTVVNYTAEDTDETYLKNILETIAEITVFYKKKNIITNEKNLEVILTGELATQAWVDWAKANLKYSVTALTTSVKNPAFNKAYIMATSQITAPYDASSINLLPVSLQETYDYERRQLFYTGLLTRFSLGLVFLVLISAGVFSAISWKRQLLEKEVKQLTLVTQREKVATQKVLLLNAQTKAIVSLAPLRKTPKDTLLVLSRLLPPGIHVSQWQYDDSKLQYIITGSADSRDILLDFKDRLEVSDEFTKISLPLGSLETAENVKFTLSFVIK